MFEYACDLEMARNDPNKHHPLIHTQDENPIPVICGGLFVGTDL